MSGRTLLQSWSDRDGAPRHWATLFPVSHWREVLPGDLFVEVEAAAPVRLMGRSRGRTVCLAIVSDAEPLRVATDEDWLWLEPEGEMRAVRWSVGAPLAPDPITAIVPTIGRIAETRTQVASFLGSGLIDLVIVIDQMGGIAEDPVLAELAREHPGRLRLVEQGNFGGSGGYARGMIESFARPGNAVLLSDDDARLEPEVLRRMALHMACARAAGVDEILGTPLLDTEDPQTLRIGAEYVRARDFFWTKADSLFTARTTEADAEGLADALDLIHAPNYAGWWGCLLPPGAVARLGAPLPLFLKWDDAEYGLRARDAGYRFTVLPGTGVHHPRWDTTKTLWSWSGVLSQRNRLAVAAARGASRGVLASSVAHQVKHILSLQYAVAESWNEAARAVARDSSWFGQDLLRAREWAVRVWDRAQGRTDERALALVPGTPVEAPADRREHRLRAAASALGKILPGRRPAAPRTIREAGAADYAWWDSLGADAIRILDHPGAPLVLDPARARRLLVRTVTDHARLALSWRRRSWEYASRARSGSEWETWAALLGITIPVRDDEERAGSAPRGEARA
ncbi:glycosyltransferase [Schaalia sp.]|uniref:glycosyltransferase n=1 Tax=Schaalia sp. TaxID=2691890 RepID=UPI003D10122C